MKLPKNVSDGQLLLPLFELARVLVRLDHVASFRRGKKNLWPFLLAARRTDCRSWATRAKATSDLP
jgi:hypothetical protein